jgi:pyrophosphatase PpaX
MRYEAVLFDLDGTLVDSGAIILASFRHATRTVLAREIPDEELVAAVGGSSILDQMRRFDEARAEELVRVYREHNEPLHEELEAFDGVVELLAQLHRESRKLGIVTAKRRATVDLAFAVLPIERFFGAVVTTESTNRHKPHADPVLRALELLDADPSDAAFVGDSPFDIGAGKAAGVFTVAVAWGGIHPAERLLEAGADVLVSTPGELLDVL